MKRNENPDILYKIGQPILMNKFFFKSCYYHGLIAALGCLQIDGIKILQNERLCVKKDFECYKYSNNYFIRFIKKRDLCKEKEFNF
jgi:hypothetical protein